MLKIGYTYGDPGGIGPEIFQKFYKNSANKFPCEIYLIDDEAELAKNSSKITIGQTSAYAGEHVCKTLEKAIKLLKNKELDFLVTGPVAKESLSLAGLEEHGGQTELLASLCGLSKDQVEMFFLLGDFKFVLATRHLALKKVSEELPRRLAGVLENSLKALTNIFDIPNPKIAVAGLNPHAGENTLFGDEEEKFIKPIMQAFIRKHQNLILEGPFAADYLFANFAKKYLKNEKADYDLYVSAYHDQALPVIKGLGGYEAINLTVGLPFLRLSVDHGTAFDIAGKNLANYQGLEACTQYCLKLHGLSSS